MSTSVHNLTFFLISWIFLQSFDETTVKKMFTVQVNRQLSRSIRRLSTTVLNPSPATESQTKSKAENIRKSFTEYRHIYPEFLPDPNVEYRNAIREKLERNDMLSRRMAIDIPEFYVGSILGVTSSDQHNREKPHKFVGICINREGCGLRATFILRNVIDHQGIEILYDMYDPTIQSIEVLKLEKRLDSKLFYLRDALPEYSTFDPNMEPETLKPGTAVPINDLKVKLRPRPWLERWERQNLRGVQDLELPEKFYKRAKELETPWEKYDLMKQYMRTIPEEEQIEIYSEIKSHLHTAEVLQKVRRKKTFVKPTKLA